MPEHHETRNHENQFDVEQTVNMLADRLRNHQPPVSREQIQAVVEELDLMAPRVKNFIPILAEKHIREGQMPHRRSHP